MLFLLLFAILLLAVLFSIIMAVVVFYHFKHFGIKNDPNVKRFLKIFTIGLAAIIFFNIILLLLIII